MNIKNLKQRNKSLLLFMLNDCGDLSRKELAIRTGLTPAAVTKLTAELIEGGYIMENGSSAVERSGRREINLTLRLNDRLLLGVTAETNAIRFSVCTFGGILLAQEESEFLDDIDEVIAKAKLFLNRSSYEICAVGVSIIGSAEQGYGVWKGDIGRAFEDAFNVPAVVENNIMSFAEAELIYGQLRNKRSALFFKWGPGVGSAIVANGRVLSGSDSGIAEIGHYIVNANGKKCRCGRTGCLETEASLNRIIEDAKALGVDVDMQNISEVQDARLDEALDRKLEMVSVALLNTATILNASEVVLFGSMFERSGIADRLIKCVRNINSDDSKVFVVAGASSLNSKRDYIGAAAICARTLFFGVPNEKKPDE